MGRRKGPLPPLDAEIIRQMFVVGDNSGEIIRASTGEGATFMGPSGALLVRCYHEGSIRRFTAARVAWAVQTGEWPKGVVRARDGDERNLKPDNLVLTKRGPRSFDQSKGGKGSSLERRQASERALLNALAEHQGALTVPQLSISVGQSAPCCCTRLAKLEARGLVCGPHCNARKRWDLTPAGQALMAGTEEASSAPIILDDRDKRFLAALAIMPKRQLQLVREIEACSLTVKRRLGRLVQHSLVAVDESRKFRITSKGRDALGDAAPVPWLRVEAISAAAAKDVRERNPFANHQTSVQLADHARKGRSGRPKGAGRWSNDAAFCEDRMAG
jgi:hypothetical protein